MVKRLAFLLLVVALAGCAGAGSPPYADDLTTRAAIALTADAHYQQGVRFATATGQAATAVAATATAGAVTATAQSARATASAATATMDAFWGEATRESGILAVTNDARDAGHTATAEHQLAGFNEQRLGAAADRLAIDNERLRTAARREANWSTFLAVLPWAILVMAAAAGGAAIWLYRERLQPRTVIENGRQVILVPPSAYAVLAGPRPPTTRETAFPRLLPAPTSETVHLPQTLRPDAAGLGLVDGAPLWLPAEGVDILGAGIKGSGKSNLARVLAYQAHINGWELHLADAEQVTFNPALWGHVAQSATEVEALLQAILARFEERFELYREAFRQVRDLPAGEQHFVESLPDYNRAASRLGMLRLKPMLLIADEANNWLGSGRELDSLLHEFLRRNRKAGAGVALFGHTWHARQVPTPISTNLSTRLAFRCGPRTSRVVLGSDAAAAIPPAAKGQAILQGAPGSAGDVTIQTYYLPAPRVLADVRPAAGSPAPVPAVVEQAEGDAVVLAMEEDRLQTLHEVAKFLAGKTTNANAEEYRRAVAALRYRVQHLGCEWSSRLLQGSSSRFVGEAAEPAGVSPEAISSPPFARR